MIKQGDGSLNPYLAIQGAVEGAGMFPLEADSVMWYEKSDACIQSLLPKMDLVT
jgi:hypothetical protein